jgi:hypothetical protein
MKVWETQIESMKQESTQIDEQINTMADQSKEYQTQMEVSPVVFVMVIRGVSVDLHL